VLPAVEVAPAEAREEAAVIQAKLDKLRLPALGEVCKAQKKDSEVLLDWATIQFRFIGPNSGYTGSFCVFGPVLSSPAHAAASLDMPLQRIKIF
jgi:hypothetical protein